MKYFQLDTNEAKGKKEIEWKKKKTGYCVWINSLIFIIFSYSKSNFWFQKALLQNVPKSLIEHFRKFFECEKPFV